MHSMLASYFWTLRKLTFKVSVKVLEIEYVHNLSTVVIIYTAGLLLSSFTSTSTEGVRHYCFVWQCKTLLLMLNLQSSFKSSWSLSFLACICHDMKTNSILGSDMKRFSRRILGHVQCYLWNTNVSGQADGANFLNLALLTVPVK